MTQSGSHGLSSSVSRSSHSKLPCATLQWAFEFGVGCSTSRIEISPLDGCANCASRLTLMPTIAKPTLGCQFAAPHHFVRNQGVSGRPLLWAQATRMTPS